MHVCEICPYAKIFSCHASATLEGTYFFVPRFNLEASSSCPIPCPPVSADSGHTYVFEAIGPPLLPRAGSQAALHHTFEMHAAKPGFTCPT